jgi:lipopolysaccharide transport system ATP-binding protein
MSDDVIIRAENIGKRYTLNHQGSSGGYRKFSDTLIQAAKAPLRWFQPASSPPQSSQEDFWALKDINFEIKQGEVVGIIGRNGAGKSTLLKILSRITEPTQGRITLNGRVASLLEVGTGFHPELTGRENIYLNGAILGMKKGEIKAKFDEIVAFAEVERFLDTPVKRYSSGMYVRLAFAVAAHLEPEILIVDEVLAVGDAEFQKKCLGKMQDVASGGRTVIFVSHNMAAISQLTKSAIVLSHGQIRFAGSTPTAIEHYMDVAVGASAVSFDVEYLPRKFQGNNSARLVSFSFPRAIPVFGPDEDFEFIAKIRSIEAIIRLRFSITIFAADGMPVGSCFSIEQQGFDQGEVHEFKLRLPSPRFAPGVYHCGVAIGKGDHRTGHVDYDVVLETLQFEVRPEEGEVGTVSSWTKGWGNIVFQPLQQQMIPAI